MLPPYSSLYQTSPTVAKSAECRHLNEQNIVKRWEQLIPRSNSTITDLRKVLNKIMDDEHSETFVNHFKALLNSDAMKNPLNIDRLDGFLMCLHSDPLVKNELVYSLIASLNKSHCDRASLYWNNIQTAFIMSRSESFAPDFFVTSMKSVYLSERLESNTAEIANRIRRDDPTFNKDVDLWHHLMARLKIEFNLPVFFSNERIITKLSATHFDKFLPECTEYLNDWDADEFADWIQNSPLTLQWLSTSHSGYKGDIRLYEEALTRECEQQRSRL